MARAVNPFRGTYRPSVISFNKEELMKGLKGLEKKIPHPNRHLTTTEYKKSLKKTPAPERGSESK